MKMFKVRLSSFGFLLLAAAVTVLGCGPSGPKLVPVSGKVTLDGTPLKSGTVTLVADASKNNTQKGIPAGAIGPDGTYKISTEGKNGAPLGWYKVTVATSFPGAMGANTAPLMSSTPAKAPEGAIVINPKYTDQTKTDLSVEVVANPQPGAYDLKLSK